jgi:hypothetical protein
MYTVVATFTSSDPSYTNGTAQTTFTITPTTSNPATPTLSVSAAGGTYNGAPFPASGTAVGVDGTTVVAGSFSFAYYPGSSATGTPLATAPTNAGTYTVVASFTSSDPSYTGGIAQTTVTINPAAPTVSVGDAGGSYNGSAFPASGTAVGVDGTTAVAGSFRFAYYAGSSASGTPLAAAPTNAGIYTVVATFISNDPNYTNGTAQTTFTVSGATLSGYSQGLVSQVLTCTVAAITASPADRAAGFTYTINWGDGSPIQTIPASPGNGSGVSVSHVFPAAGTYTVALTAIDQYGGVHGVSSTVTILPRTSANLNTVLHQQGAILFQNPTKVWAGKTVTFTARGAGAVQWQISTDGGATFTNIQGATAPTLTFPATLARNGEEFRAIFTNAQGTLTTPIATLTVTAPPVVVTQPRNQTVAVNATATFRATANGNPAPTVQWQVSTDHGKSYKPIAGATSATLTLSSVTTSESGNLYRAVFTSTLGTVTTRAATLTVDVPPAITKQPVSEAARASQMVTFTAAASGTTPKVQWQVSTDGGKTFTNLAGATSATLSFTAAARQNGYRYRAIFSNAVGQVTSDSAQLLIW